jgi:hypothetical protein
MGEVLPVEFWVVNDAPEGHAGCRAEARLDGRIFWSASGVDVRSSAASRIGSTEIILNSPPTFLELALFSASGRWLSENCYDLGAPHPKSAPPRLKALIHEYGMRLIGG